jgi:putative ABC transport system ATP-binding protein
MLDGNDICGMKKNDLARLRNRKLGFVFQSYNLLSRTSALENVELPLYYSDRIRTKERREKAVQALEAVGLSDRMHHMPNQLSGGQQQRVAIARSLINDPIVILADEPTGNLDTRNSYEIMELFQDLNDQGKTIVMVTHEPELAQLAKRNVVFRDGRIQTESTIRNRQLARELILSLPPEDEE